MANKLEVTVKFLGANSGYVTGSATLVTIKRGDTVRNILVDYGEYQDDDYMNFDRVILGDSIDCVLLTHSHLDHCGALPLLFKCDDCDIIPFTGKIYASRETCNQAAHILWDSAKVHTLNASFSPEVIEKYKTMLSKLKRKAIREDAKPKEIATLDSEYSYFEEESGVVLYTIEDAEEAIRHFHPIDFKRGQEYVDITLYEGIVARFKPVPHINGSCMIELTATYEEQRYSMCFTGDIGRDNSILYNRSILSVNPDVSAIVLESLHGAQRETQTIGEARNELRSLLYFAKKHNKTVIIPTFALDRTAGLIKIFNEFMDSGFNFDVYIDSPMGIRELQEYIGSYKTGTSAWFNYSDGFPFSTIRMNVIDSYQSHMRLTKESGFHVVLTSSGMGFGGRVLDYFEHYVQDRDAIFIFPGYLVEGCPSRILHEAKSGKVVYLNSRMYIKRCRTFWIDGFSSHGYIDEKLALLSLYPNLRHIFLNHGDDESVEELSSFLIDHEGYDEDCVINPLYDDSFRLL